MRVTDVLRDPGSEGPPGGCLKVAVGAAALVVISPFALVVRRWRAWRRGGELRSTLATRPFANSGGGARRWIDLTLDVPAPAEPGFRRRLTEAIVRVAEELRRPDDVYHLVYRRPGDAEPVLLPVGPQLQELGERFSLVLAQGSLAGRTVVWLTLGRGRALAEVVNPASCDPEGEGEPEALLATAEARWSMAGEWARIGPSLVVRLILVVPADAEERVKAPLRSLT